MSDVGATRYILDGLTEEQAEVVINECGKTIDDIYVPIFCCHRESAFLNHDNRDYNPNFVEQPGFSKLLHKPTRDFWRMWNGRWLDQDGELKECRREFIIGDTEYDQVSVDLFVTHERVFGKQCYHLWPLNVLKGPCTWFNRLSEGRKEEHLRWVDTVMKVNSLVPIGYEGLTQLSQLPADFFYDDSVPETQLYINNLPEMQDLELTNMINSWFGVLYPGNPFIISLSLLKQDPHNNQGVLSNGLAAVRFITRELAEYFKKLFNGVRIYYTNYDVERYKNDNWQQLSNNKVAHNVIWYHTNLDVSWTAANKKRGFRRNEFPHHELLHRGTASERGWGKHQHCLWQKDFAAYDYVQWPIGYTEIKWLVDPYTGEEFNHEQRLDRHFLPFVCGPDASYWAAMGCLNPKVDLTVRQDHLGCWINQREREKAWEDDTFFTEVQGQQRNVHLNTSLPTHRAARNQAGRAVSRAPSRRPNRR